MTVIVDEALVQINPRFWITLFNPIEQRSRLMDRLDSMRLFTRIVDLGSFTAAAEESGTSRSTVTYAMQSLERRLGARLLLRSTRHVSTTPEGQGYYERCLRRRRCRCCIHASAIFRHASGRSSTGSSNRWRHTPTEVAAPPLQALRERSCVLGWHEHHIGEWHLL